MDLTGDDEIPREVPYIDLTSDDGDDDVINVSASTRDGSAMELDAPVAQALVPEGDVIIVEDSNQESVSRMWGRDSIIYQNLLALWSKRDTSKDIEVIDLDAEDSLPQDPQGDASKGIEEVVSSPPHAGSAVDVASATSASQMPQGEQFGTDAPVDQREPERLANAEQLQSQEEEDEDSAQFEAEVLEMMAEMEAEAEEGGDGEMFVAADDEQAAQLEADLRGVMGGEEDEFEEWDDGEMSVASDDDEEDDPTGGLLMLENPEDSI